MLVVAEPGVGKTSFLKWFLKRAEVLLAIGKDAVTVLDLRTTPYNEEDHKNFIGHVKARLADAMLSHLQLLGDPCNDIEPDDNTVKNQGQRYDYCASKLAKLETPARSPNNPIHYFFLDDVDYLPSHCFVEVLEYFKPLLFSRFFCVIIACRTPAHNTIRSHRDYNVSRAFDDAKLLRLHPLPVHNE